MNIVSRAKEVLGSHIDILIPESKDPQYSDSILSECFSELDRIQATYSRFLDTSILSQMNSKLGEWHTVSDEFLDILLRAEELRKLTDGNFDITVKSTLDRLGYDKDYSFVEKKDDGNAGGPEDEQKSVLERIKDTLTDKINTKNSAPILIDAKKKRVMLNKEIEIGGFGKGFAIDRIRSILEKNGILHYFINAGGDVYAKADSGSGEKEWDVLLENPDDLSQAIGKIKLDSQALACSAPNRRKWGKDKQYHHLINAKTRLPENSVKAIFVLANSGIEADGYATALFTAGYAEAIRLSRRLPVKICIISARNEMFVSGGFAIEFFTK